MLCVTIKRAHRYNPISESMGVWKILFKTYPLGNFAWFENGPITPRASIFQWFKANLAKVILKISVTESLCQVVIGQSVDSMEAHGFEERQSVMVEKIQVVPKDS